MTVGQLRDRVVARLPLGGHTLICACSALGLACLFCGIWLGDAQFKAALGNVHSTLVMRIASFMLYGLFLLTVLLARKRGSKRISGFFTATIVVGILAFLAGILLLKAGGLTGSTTLTWAGFVLSKVIGAPATIGLVCVFSQLGRTLTIRLSTLGMLGAFLLYGFIGQLAPAGAGVDWLHLNTAALLIVLACIFGMFGLDEKNFGTVKMPAHGGAEPMPVKRPMKQVVTPGLLILLALSAVTLGYLRSGFSGTDVHLRSSSTIMLALLICISLLWKRMRVEHLFYTAFLCTAASILLRPLFGPGGAEAAGLLAGVGTSLFEVVVWVYAVWTARNSGQSLLAASISRMATVAGHLVGTLAVAAGILLSTSLEEAGTVSGMLVMFLYMVMLLVILKNPGMKAPIMTIESVEESFCLSPEAQAPDRAGKDRPVGQDKAGAGKPDAGKNPPAKTHEDIGAAQPPSTGQEGHDGQDYWAAPVAHIAQAYRLTRRETDVFKLIARGHSLASVEESLCISHNTVKMHMRNIYTKLEVHSRQDVIDMVELVRAQQG